MFAKSPQAANCLRLGFSTNANHFLCGWDGAPHLKRGTRALLIVVVATALVLTPLILFGVYLGFYVADAVGYSRSVMAIAFSTIGFLAGMAVLFKVIKAVVGATDRPTG